ncbi:MAG TPA: histone deacetylase [Parvularcula sp.]|nr:histone deacetylase [Parvularcula sp.]
MRVFFSDHFDLRLPAGHRFPGTKYGLLRRKLLEEDILPEAALSPSPEALPAAIAAAHDPVYVQAIRTGAISATTMRRIGFPWSEHLWRRSAATMGGAIAAARAALDDGVSGQLAGGTHHAHHDFGAGYCVFNDFAIVAMTLLPSPACGRGVGREGAYCEGSTLIDAPAPGASRHPLPQAGEGKVRRIAIVDLDVHQGDGNAAILGGREDVFIFSMHGAKNFPFRKEKSTLDVELPDGVEDDEYLRALAEHLPAVWAFRPDLVLYQAGVDPLKEDRLGRMALTHRGLKERDRMVLAGACARGIPVSIAIGGGYALPIAASIEAYANTWRVARNAFTRA